MGKAWVCLFGTNSAAYHEERGAIGLVGREMATSYEEAQGWRAEDVSEKDHGSSGLRSVLIGEDGTIVDVRYIEVKARSRSGAIRITSNERKQARRCGEDCWLYVVTQAGTEKPELTARIPSPGAHFEEGEGIFAAGSKVPEDKWRQEAGV